MQRAFVTNPRTRRNYERKSKIYVSAPGARQRLVRNGILLVRPLIMLMCLLDLDGLMPRREVKYLRGRWKSTHASLARKLTVWKGSAQMSRSITVTLFQSLVCLAERSYCMRMIPTMKDTDTTELEETIKRLVVRSKTMPLLSAEAVDEH